MNESKKPKVSIFTDGACSPNPGRGGYGTILQFQTEGQGLVEREFSAGYQLTTNNRMELLAVIVGIEALIVPCEVLVTTDSKYVADAFLKNWISGWERKNFKDVKNPDLWKRLISAMKPHDVKFRWVKGHNGHEENERCDQLAVQKSKGTVLLIDEGYHAWRAIL